MKKLMLSLTILFAMICSLSFAQSTSSGTADTTTINFVTNATVANMKEIAAGKIAQKKAKDPAVKSFGAQMVDHHTMATKQMAALVKSKGFKVPTPPISAVAPDSALVSAKGADFDRMYMSQMVADHQKTIQLFETASTNVTDPDIKAFAVKTLPLLKQHLASAQSIVSKLGTGTTSGK